LRVLLRISRVIDAVNAVAGIVATAAVMVGCAVSAGNALLRYGLSISSNAWLEIQWYMFGVTVLLGAAYTLAKNEHVRIDIIYGHVSMRAQLWIDIVGMTLFLLPTCLIIGWVSWPLFSNSYAIGEISSNAGGLIRWPVKLLLPLGFALLGLQGLSEIIKRIAALQGHPELVARYEKPLQ
jgi:TRAP-type mannitol/chloroaromatic compound transport system permease small subunit